MKCHSYVVSQVMPCTSISETVIRHPVECIPHTSFTHTCTVILISHHKLCINVHGAGTFHDSTFVSPDKIKALVNSVTFTYYNVPK